MGEPSPQNSIDKKMLSRLGIAGAILGAVIIGLFVILWVILGNMGVGDFPRLVASVCLPPTLLAFIVGIYLLSTRSSH